MTPSSFSRNITNDGKMSKRQLAVAYKGLHGMEARYYALTHMSDENMMKAESKNQQLSQKHDKDMKQIQDHENYLKDESTRAIKAMRDDFTAMLAYQYVYKSTNLKNVEKAKEKAVSAKRKRPNSDRYDLLESERRAASSKGPRPLGSLRELERYRDELKLKFPAVDKKADNKEKPTVNMLGEKHYESRATSRNTNDTLRSSAFPKIEDALGVEIKYRNRTDKDSFFSAPGEIDHDTRTDVRIESRTSITEFDMGQNLVMMRKKEQEKFERRRMLPQTPAQNVQHKTDRECKRRKLPSLPPRSPKLYPNGVKNAHDLHNFIRREATDIIEFWSQDQKRYGDFEKPRSVRKPEPSMYRSQTTTEMLREMNQHKQQEQQFREQVDTQSMLVRQLTPKPRPMSPVSTRMTEYSSRISSPQPRERSPSFRQKREGSEKIPSVSRTSSYKELPDGPIEIHENALLTAAERIEKEKLEKERLEKENTMLQRQITMAKISLRKLEEEELKNKDKTKSSGRPKELPSIKKKRLLPQTTWSQDASAAVENKDIKIERRPTLSDKSDFETIDAVSKANTLKENVLREFERKILGKPKLEPISKAPVQSDKQYSKMAEALDTGFHNERNAYTPLSRSTGPIKRRLTPIPDAHVDDQLSHQGLPGNPSLGKLGKKIPFSYDKFSRVPPDAKKRLELRVKNKKKAQQHNAKIEEEKENDSKANATRPSTRVSFNEKVMVFQTI